MQPMQHVLSGGQPEKSAVGLFPAKNSADVPYSTWCENMHHTRTHSPLEHQKHVQYFLLFYHQKINKKEKTRKCNSVTRVHRSEGESRISMRTPAPVLMRLMKLPNTLRVQSIDRKEIGFGTQPGLDAVSRAGRSFYIVISVVDISATSFLPLE